MTTLSMPPESITATLGAARQARSERLRQAMHALTASADRRGPRALLTLGAVLQPLGGALILLGWSGAAATTDVWEQIPYLISGGLFGLALVVGGGFCYFSYWQTEAVRTARRGAHNDELLLESLQRIEVLLAAMASPPPPPEAPRTRQRALRARAGGGS